jgi:hypothetical protein
MLRVVTSLGLAFGGSIFAVAAIWIARNAETLFSWSPRDWEHDDRDHEA